MKPKKVRPPKHLRRRLEDVAKQHGFESSAAVVDHFLARGLARFDFVDSESPVAKQIAQLVEVRGYASQEEAIEHLLVRGLRAYEQVQDDPKALKERLRGLGYID